MGTRLYALWRRLEPWPGGRRLFDWLLGIQVPYSGSLGARIRALEPGYARLELRERRAIRNHLQSIHALALANLGELTCGLALVTALPPEIRGIPITIHAEYLKKARGRLTAESRPTVPRVVEPMEHQVSADIRDEADEVVARISVRWRLAPVSP